MIAKTGKIMVLLLDGGSASKGRVRRWLMESGFVTWEAIDICHAIEEISDYTVRNRPDVVLLQVPALPESFDSFRSLISPAGEDLQIVALSKSKEGRDRRNFVAHNFVQLKTIMRGGAAAA